jgi:hypothetical protein
MSLGGEKDHLGASPQPHVASSTVELFQFCELLGASSGTRVGFMTSSFARILHPSEFICLYLECISKLPFGRLKLRSTKPG